MALLAPGPDPACRAGLGSERWLLLHNVSAAGFICSWHRSRRLLSSLLGFFETGLIRLGCEPVNLLALARPFSFLKERYFLPGLSLKEGDNRQRGDFLHVTSDCVDQSGSDVPVCAVRSCLDSSPSVCFVTSLTLPLRLFVHERFKILIFRLDPSSRLSLDCAMLLGSTNTS